MGTQTRQIGQRIEVGSDAADTIPIRMGVGGESGRGGDRRRHTRVETVRPCKVFRQATCRYTAASTRDVSAGGVLLEIEASRPIVAGERIGVGIAWTGSAILSEASMIEGVVVRVEDAGEDRQTVAVRFAGAEGMAVAA